MCRWKKWASLTLMLAILLGSVQVAVQGQDGIGEGYFAALQPEAIHYLGAFQLPMDGDTEEEMFSWGGEAIAFAEERESLFVVGHNWFTYVAEISVPDPVMSEDVSQLPMAELLQPLTDIRDGLFDRWYLEIPRVGLEVMGDDLYFCWGAHYQDEEGLGTHGVHGLDLSEESADHVVLIGDHNYSTNDYLFKIDAEWREAFFDGMDLVTGRFRDGGWSGMGPALFAFSGEDLKNGEMDEEIDAFPLILYSDSYEGDEGSKMEGYSHADSWSGGAWVGSEVGSAVVFVGTHGWGETWYGFSNGVVYPTSGDADEEIPEVPEWPHDERGWWNDDFRATMIFYDANDLVKVREGSLMADEVQPYAMLDINEFLLGVHDETAMQYLGGVAYDAQQQRLFVMELFADEGRPVVHVFGIY